MAKLRSPINQIQKNGLRGVIDFCYWKGIPYARSWPRKSNLVPTAKQQYYRDLMSASNAAIHEQPPLQREAWRATCTQPGATWVDYFKRMYFALDKTDDNQQMPYFTAMTASYTFSDPTLRVYARWNPGQQPAIQPFQIYWRAAEENEVAVQWVYSGMSNSDGRKTTKFYEMDLKKFQALKPTEFDQANGRAIFDLPFSSVSGIFVAGQKLDQVNEDYVQTPVYFLEPEIQFEISCVDHISAGRPDDPRFFLQTGGVYDVWPSAGSWYTPLWQGDNPKYNRLYYGEEFPLLLKPCFTGLLTQTGETYVLPGTTEEGFDSQGLAEYYYESFLDNPFLIRFQSGPVYTWYEDNYVFDNVGTIHYLCHPQEDWSRQILPRDTMIL